MMVIICGFPGPMAGSGDVLMVRRGTCTSRIEEQCQREDGKPPPKTGRELPRGACQEANPDGQQIYTNILKGRTQFSFV
jgi:hypothetical protein